MKILAFVDIHGSFKLLDELEPKAAEADVLVSAGDISRFEMELDKILGKVNSFGKPVLIIHGNHENPKVLEDACRGFKNIIFAHKKAQIINNMLFLGFGGLGFEKSTPEMEQFFKKHHKELKNSKEVVFITHAPPYNTALDKINSSHNGNNTLRNVIIKYQPNILVCGHFHENSGKTDILGNAKLVNPGPSGVLLEL
ncbi:metallophosphoesterase [Candidatus Woesearchaeota archaeon]|nr:metallophosphoesterase [Candidatus Woesearchaeota archaeon]